MENDESMDRALADLEMLKAAYPDECCTSSAHPSDMTNDAPTHHFPLHCSFYLSEDSFVQLEFTNGYPITSGVQISKYRSPNKERMDAVVRVIRKSSAACLENQVEGAFVCCAAALETWNEYPSTPNDSLNENIEDIIQQPLQDESPPLSSVEWIIAAEPLVDRKSSFLAHACRVTSEQQVHDALHQLLNGNSKLQRATHNMYAYRLYEELPNGVVVKKFDNNDDGEHGAGTCLAHLLEVRGEEDVLVVVSRWYGGTKLGPRRFAHITNVARDLLDKCHQEHWKED